VKPESEQWRKTYLKRFVAGFYTGIDSPLFSNFNETLFKRPNKL